MRFMLAVIALSLLPGCSRKGCGPRSDPGVAAASAASASAPDPSVVHRPPELLTGPDERTDWDAAQALAQADFVRETARTPMPPLPSGVTTVIQCCVEFNPMDAPVVASVALLLPQPEDSLAASRPRLTLGGYSIALAPAPRILARPDFSAVRRKAAGAARDALTAYALAHGKLVGLARYQDWKSVGLPYSTYLQEESSRLDGKKAWSVYFGVSAKERIDSIEISVDVGAHAVIGIHAGAERKELPI